MAPFEQRPSEGERLSLVIEPDLPDLRLDRKGFDEALSNLVQNALSHGGDGGQVVVTARPEDDGVAFEVRDSGPGVAEKDLAHLFERVSGLGAVCNIFFRHLSGNDHEGSERRACRCRSRFFPVLGVCVRSGPHGDYICAEHAQR